ncbi:hypothetical protein FOA43_000326 [Brettanomyces nanus]|uniref:Enoyl reductase (ER) domain-containing protein n=1 Tax=Eeniella nana TaxID=13502 RepID=A0A875RYN0_EENNA|nr:uncharacterized protein FOA43_000326 [Brettanomyces nanus]QPG73022.1 hypothetical protein FOA43_000326 [Brettanomyces nanus]
MTYPDTFEGFAVFNPSPETWSTVKKYEFTPKPFEDHDVDIKIQTCSICGSDVHSATNGWNKTNAYYPLVPGHEIIGKVVRLGPKVTDFKLGDRVGVGAQAQACLKCKICKSNNEIYCPHLVHTFGGVYQNQDGTETHSQGGYSNYARINDYFVFHIPEELSNEEAAPMLCAGITTFSPLVRNIPKELPEGQSKPRVGIVGLGGLGMMGIQWAHALGCETFVFSRTSRKKADAIKLGADQFIATAEDPDWVKKVEFDLDLVVCTANSAEGFDLNTYLRSLKIGGKWVNVGLPETPFTVSPRSFMANACFMGASHLGSHVEMIRMFKLAVEKGVRAWVEKIPISSDGVKEGLERCRYNKCRYRVALTDFDKAFA